MGEILMPFGVLPRLVIPEDVSLNIFYSSLDMKSAIDLEVASRGLFAQTTPAEGRDILDTVDGH